MIEMFENLFKKKKNVVTISSTSLSDSPLNKEDNIDFNIREIVSSKEGVLLRVKYQVPIILCQDIEGTVQEGLPLHALGDYEIIEINTKTHPGPFNIFAGMTRDEVRTYARFLAPPMEQTVLTDLSRVLIHSVLLAMLEANDLSWKKFTALISSASREKPEYVVTAIDDEIVQAFKSFKDLTKYPEKIIKQFDKYKTREYWDATQGIVQNNDRVIVFFRNYSDPVLNKFLEYKLKKF